MARHLPLDDLLALGLVGGGAELRAVVDVRPYGEPDTDWYVVSDHGPDSSGHTVPEVAVDHVLGVGGARLTLARITPRAQVDRALDLGTGCGVQALHLGRHAREIVATDRNRRALRLAALSAALSGQQWDLREGSLFEPVGGEQFDLVVSNPPFVISPGHRYTYRDAGLPADDLGRLLVQQAPSHLRDSGTAVVLANWLHVRGEDWRERVATWVEGTGCDAWVAQREVQDPAEYVGLWLRDAGGGEDRAEHDRRYGEWLDALSDMDAEGIGFGWIVLHKGGTWGAQGPRVEDVAHAPRLPDGARGGGARRRPRRVGGHGRVRPPRGGAAPGRRSAPRRGRRGRVRRAARRHTSAALGGRRLAARGGPRLRGRAPRPHLRRCHHRERGGRPRRGCVRPRRRRRAARARSSPYAAWSKRASSACSHGEMPPFLPCPRPIRREVPTEPWADLSG